MRPKTQSNVPQAIVQFRSASFEESPSKISEVTAVIEKISLEQVSLEERRREAKKPLYLIRYE